MRISDWSSDVCSSDLIQLDATFGVPISALSQTPPMDHPARKVFEIGVHSVWALRLVGGSKSAKGDWAGYHRSKSNNKDAAWEDFWARIAMIEKIGAIWYEAWIFDSEEPDAEPLFPVDFAALYHQSEGDDRSEEHTSELQSLMRISYAVHCL